VIRHKVIILPVSKQVIVRFIRPYSKSVLNALKLNDRAVICTKAMLLGNRHGNFFHVIISKPKRAHEGRPSEDEGNFAYYRIYCLIFSGLESEEFMNSARKVKLIAGPIRPSILSHVTRVYPEKTIIIKFSLWAFF
jgi:hypothetical protein